MVYPFSLDGRFCPFFLYRQIPNSHFPLCSCPQWQSSQLYFIIENSDVSACVFLALIAILTIFNECLLPRPLFFLCFFSPQFVWFLLSAAGQMGTYGTLIINSTLMSDPSFIFVWSWWQHTLNLSEYLLWKPSKKNWSIRCSLNTSVCLVPFSKRMCNLRF